jgi:hypothetical protein
MLFTRKPRRRRVVFLTTLGYFSRRGEVEAPREPAAQRVGTQAAVHIRPEDLASSVVIRPRGGFLFVAAE